MSKRKNTAVTGRLEKARPHYNSIVNSPALLGANLLFVFSALCLLWWFEATPAKPQSLEGEMLQNAKRINPSAYQARYDNHLVYFSGNLQSRQPLGDPGYLKPVNALRLERMVEMYQWLAPQKKAVSNKGNAKASLETPPLAAWRSVDRPLQALKNSQFRNPLPTQRNKTFYNKISLGSFDLTAVKLPVLPGQVLKLQPKMLQISAAWTDGMWLYANNKRSPKIGDLRFSYRVVSPGQTISIVGLQKGRSLIPYESNLGGPKVLLKSGKVPLEKLSSTKSSPSTKEDSWLWRILASLLLTGGLFIALLPFSENLILPPLPANYKQTFLGIATFFVSCLIVFVLTLVIKLFPSFWTVALCYGAFAATLFFAHQRRRSSLKVDQRVSMVELPPETTIPDRYAS